MFNSLSAIEEGERERCGYAAMILTFKQPSKITKTLIVWYHERKISVVYINRLLFENNISCKNFWTKKKWSKLECDSVMLYKLRVPFGVERRKKTC